MFRLLFFGIFILVIGIFTVIALSLQGAISWIMYAFLTPFWATFPMVSLGVKIGAILLGIYLLGFPALKLWLAKSKKGKALTEKWQASAAGTKSKSGRSSRRGGGFASSGWSWSSGGGSSGGGFSGGGGSFSGGGASGSW